MKLRYPPIFLTGSIVLFSAFAISCSINSDDGRKDLGVPLDVTLGGMVERTINSLETEYRTYMNVSSTESEEEHIQSFQLQIQALTVREESGMVIQDRLLLSISQLGGIPDPGRYETTSSQSDSTFFVSIIYNEQRRNTSTSVLEQELSLMFRSGSGFVKVLKSNSGDFRGKFEIVADLNTGVLVERDGSGNTQQTDYDPEEEALVLTGEFKVE